MVKVCLTEGKLVLIFCAMQIVGFTFFTGFSNMGGQQSSIVGTEMEKRNKRCFLLFWSNLSLNELANSTAKPFSYYSGNSPIQRIKASTAERKFICNRFFMINDIKGRIGNQLFQVASLIGMAYKHDAIPVIQDNILLAKYFNLPNIIDIKNLRKIDDVITCDCKRCCAYYNCSKEISSGKNVSFRGYLQSWKYFEQAKNIIQKVFTAETVHVVKARKYLQSISIPGYQRVCIHIRRGDFMTKDLKRRGFVSGDVTIIEKAKAFYVKKYVHIQFIAVSDDKAWCRKKLKNTTLSPFNDAGDDMALLMLCDHVIVTGGTFGWWGAWLSGGTTVYFTGYPRPGSFIYLQTNRQELYPCNWIGMA